MADELANALIAGMRDVAGRIADLVHWFDCVGLVLGHALAHRLPRGELGLAIATPASAQTTVSDG